jgi:hypothetical protein
VNDRSFHNPCLIVAPMTICPLSGRRMSRTIKATGNGSRHSVTICQNGASD